MIQLDQFEREYWNAVMNRVPDLNPLRIHLISKGVYPKKVKVKKVINLSTKL